MLKRIFALADRIAPAAVASAHCDGPCGIYDPASARISAEAVRSMTKKMLALSVPSGDDAAANATYHNTMARYVAIKEQQAHETKEHLLVLWTDYFKPEHLTAYPDLHNTFWQAAKLCSSCKVEVSPTHCDELVDAVKQIHDIFWKTKNREIAWYLAG